MTAIVKYRDYYGSIEASPEDGCLYGRLLYIQPLVNFEGDTVPETEAAFRAAVDDYLADCDARGVSPAQPCKGTFNVRVGHALHLSAVQAATREGISLNELVRRALEQYLPLHGQARYVAEP